MESFALFLRGVNVGGRNSLPMADLRACLSDSGLRDVRTYIQSGNAVFRAPPEAPVSLARRIGDAIEARVGFRPAAQVLPAGDLRAAVAAVPFTGAAPGQVHLWLLSAPPDSGAAERLERLRAPRERFELAQSVLYVEAPDGIARSALANRAERILGVSATARNLRTMTAVLDLASPGAAPQ